MDYSNLTAEKLLKKLEAAGDIPDPALIKAIYDLRAETEPLLLIMFREAIDDDWYYGDDPRWYRFVHAGMFMIAWQNYKSLPVFRQLYCSDDRDLLNWCEWFEEELYQFGPAAIPILKSVLEKDTGGEWHFGVALAGSTLTRIAKYYPNTRDEVVDILRAQLPSLDEIPEFKANAKVESVAMDLGLIGDKDSHHIISALIEANLLDEGFFEEDYYLDNMNRGFRSEPPPAPFDIWGYYQRMYEDQQRFLKRRERLEKRERRIEESAAHSSRQIGRNDPCPCGSGKKYKHCHGRPGA